MRGIKVGPIVYQIRFFVFKGLGVHSGGGVASGEQREG